LTLSTFEPRLNQYIESFSTNAKTFANIQYSNTENGSSERALAFNAFNVTKPGSSSLIAVAGASGFARLAFRFAVKTSRPMSRNQ
jgi:hypothetical protein